MPKIRPRDKQKFSFPSEKRSLIPEKQKISVKEENFCISFEYFDSGQKYASSFKDWQKEGWLSKMLETLAGFCKRPLQEQFDGYKFKAYDSFPPKEKTMFERPKNIPLDAHWARIHILNKAVVVGHYYKNIFYVVFLDKEHKFWLSEK
ncbi:MAG: hypothetical protein J5773_03300 [Verrucomicrobia bacterium]|nr:hypothetical protein [Verrucomicrobiota bacterium]MBR5738160.1 hypothetical protein [Verrucomicrobiota bacterium]